MDKHQPADDTAGASELLARAYIHIGELETALVTSRTIGAAVGILMVRRRLTYEAAFDLLNTLSQRSHVKIRDLADVVLYTGDLPANGANGVVPPAGFEPAPPPPVRRLGDRDDH